MNRKSLRGIQKVHNMQVAVPSCTQISLTDLSLKRLPEFIWQKWGEA